MKTHYNFSKNMDAFTACGQWEVALETANWQDVTCENCKATNAWKQAKMAAEQKEERPVTASEIMLNHERFARQLSAMEIKKFIQDFKERRKTLLDIKSSIEKALEGI